MRLRSTIAVLAGVVLTIGVTYVVVDRIDTYGGENTIEGVPASSTSVPGTGATVLRPDQARVTGSVTGLHVEGAVLDPRRVPMPLTVNAERGFGNGALVAGATEGGQPISIQWDAGTPLVMSGDGALVPDPLVLDLGPDGVVAAVGGLVCHLEPGPYTIASPVAVGTSGVAEPRSSVSFEATDATVIEFSGSPTFALPSRVRATGPGLVQLTGTLTVETHDGTRDAGHVELGEGAFELTIDQSAGSVTVTALLQGDIAIT